MHLGNIGQASDPFDQVGRELVLVVLEAQLAAGAELGQQALVDQAGQQGRIEQQAGVAHC